jgi:hypothetical protein
MTGRMEGEGIDKKGEKREERKEKERRVSVFGCRREEKRMIYFSSL